MLSSISVHDWKSVKDATLNLDPLTVLIGTNSSGKSNILDALAFLSRIANGALLTSALQGDGALSPMRGGLEWAPRKHGSRFKISATTRADQHQDLTFTIECVIKDGQCFIQSEQLVRTKYRPKAGGKRGAAIRPVQLFWTDDVSADSPTVTARLYNSKRGAPRVLSRMSSVLFQLLTQRTLSEIQEGLEVMAEALRSIFILDPIPSNMRGFSPLADRLAPDASNIAGVLAALPPASKEQIETKLTRYVAELPEREIDRVYAEKVGKFGSDAMLYCEERFGSGGPKQTVDARGMSDGTLRFVAIITALLTRPPNSLLVIEEVDNGLHPSRSSLLLSMLADEGNARSVDVLVTTHNPALLDAMGTALVPFITVAHRDPSDGTTRLTLLEELGGLPKLLAWGLVGRISSHGLIEKALKDQCEAAQR